MARLLSSYLHTLRKQWGLSQPELAALFGVTASAMSRFENLSRRPTAELIIGTEVIFGQSARDVFPALYREVEETILLRARELQKQLHLSSDPARKEKLRLLEEIIERANPSTITS
jgi:transcriptional regulator with XRE-family HTH domain